MNITSTKKNSPVVLIVEDDRFTRIQLRRLLEKEGYRVVEAADGEEGLAAYRANRPDIVLVDAVMPVMDGFTFCSKLQAVPGSAIAPVLMTTMLEDEESVNRAFAVGATDYITKPINWAVLRQRVRRLLEASQATEKLWQQTERERLISRIGERIRQSLNLQEILNTTVAEVREFLKCDRVLFYRVWANGAGRVVAEAVAPEWPVILGENFTDPFFRASYLRLSRQGQVRAIADVEQTDVEEEYVEFLQMFGVKADLVVPILQGEAFWGLLIAHHCTSARHWSNLEIELLQHLAWQVSIALAQAQYLETIQESEERFRQSAENIDQVFFLESLDRILYISPAYEEIWGCSCESLYKQPLSWLDLVYPEDRDRLQTAWTEQKQSGKAIDEEYRIVRNDGTIRWIRARTFPIRNEKGEIYRIPGIAEDVTSRKQAEVEIYQALQKEKELSELRARFVTMTSHEFRTPLSTILSSTELLEYYSNNWPEDKKLEHLRRIKISVQNMDQLLNDILIFGKAEAGKIRFNPEALDLTKFCRDLVEELQLRIGKNYAIAFVSQGACSNVCMDEKLLQHILSNLLSNAIKYSPKGGTINFELACEQSEAIFRVQDCGIGIPVEEQEQLFRPFERGSNVGNIAGTGLGLAIVKNCVDIHGGTITVKSEVGVGTTFTVTLPLSPSH